MSDPAGSPHPARPVRPAHPAWRRAALLVACVAAGTLVALVGRAVVDSQTWWLAIPAAMAIGWLWVSDPTRCEPPR